MPITAEDFKKLVQLVEDGELDEYMLALRDALDERNNRRKEGIRKLVKSVWGEDAEIVNGAVVSQATPAQRHRTDRAPVEYQPDTGPAIPSAAGDSMTAEWPSPIESSGGGGGQGSPPYSPVADPIAGTGGGDPYGDGDPNIVSTGAQIG